MLFRRIIGEWFVLMAALIGAAFTIGDTSWLLQTLGVSAYERWLIPAVFILFAFIVMVRLVRLQSKIEGLENQLKRPKLFDVKWKTTSMSLLIAKKEDGQWVAGTGAIGPAPIILINKKNLLTVTRLTLAPEARFIRNNGWQSTNAIVIKPQQQLSPSISSTSVGLDWDVTKKHLWELKGLPLNLAIDEPITLPGMFISVADVVEAGKHFDGGEQCSLAVRLTIRTDKGSQDILELCIGLTPSGINNIGWMLNIN